jgi:hypothetical protein
MLEKAEKLRTKAHELRMRAAHTEDEIGRAAYYMMALSYDDLCRQAEWITERRKAIGCNFDCWTESSR